MRIGILIIAFLITSSISVTVHAHEVRPAYLELRQTGADTYDVLWKVPARGDLRLGIYVTLPEDAQQLTEPRAVLSDDAYVERWSIRRAGGLADQEIRFAGLAGSQIDVLTRVEHANGAVQTVRVLPDKPAFVVEQAPSAWSVSRTYLVLGIEHILLGIDHLLYILAMLLLVKGWKRIVWTLTAFTLTHSITLSAAALGYVHVPSPPVEAMIALSIVFVAREILRTRRGTAGLTHRWPWVISFTFGLLHGFGFAGALSDVGLPAHAIPAALLFFNVGVELGQLAFVGGMLGLFAIARRAPLWRPSWSWRLAPYAIGALAMFWVIERTAGFLP